MMLLDRWFKWLVGGLILIGGGLPVLIYALAFGSAPGLSSDEALLRLNEVGSRAVLVDVRSAQEFAQQHVVGAYHLPLIEIASLRDAADLPTALQGKELLLICESGVRSAQAARSLQALGFYRVYSIRGGMQSWIRSSAEHPELAFSQIESGGVAGVIFRPMPLVQQVATIISGFGFKPLHMLLSLALGLLLLRQRPNDLRITGWGLLIFFAAEAACAVNYLVFDHQSYLAEYLHSFGMVLAFSFTIYALMEGLDRRVLHLSAPDKRCMLLGLCRGCIKYQQPVCKAQRLLLLGTGMLLTLGFLPLAAETSNASYSTNILGTPYHYCRLLLYQYYESRYLPASAIVLLGLAFLLLLKRMHPISAAAHLFLAAGGGALLFGFFRLMLGMVFEHTLVWADFWEETTELMFVAGIAGVVWIYREALLEKTLRKEQDDSTP